MKRKLICDHCSVEFERYESSLKENQQYCYCSRKCKSSHQSITFTGENNPNFGQSWSHSQKKEQSLLVTERMAAMGSERRKESCGKSNRGVVRSAEFLAKWHATQKVAGYIRPPKTDSQKKDIGIKSAAKFTPEFKKKYRQTMELNGIWVPKNEENAYCFYKKQSDWVSKMWDLVPLPTDFVQVGIFNTRINQKGYVRDHQYSRRDGFRNKVLPEILRHPANCAIITHSENVRKRDHSTISLEELFDKIEGHCGEWPEQELCEQLISVYRQNFKWDISYEQ